MVKRLKEKDEEIQRRTHIREVNINLQGQLELLSPSCDAEGVSTKRTYALAIDEDGCSWLRLLLATGLIPVEELSG